MCARMAANGRGAPVLLFTARPIGVGCKSTLSWAGVPNVGAPVSERCLWPSVLLSSRRASLLPIAPVPIAYPPRPGRRGFCLQRTGRMTMLHTLRGRLSRASDFFYFWSRARPEIDHLSGLFRAHSGARLAQDGRIALVRSLSPSEPTRCLLPYNTLRTACRSRTTMPVRTGAERCIKKAVREVLFPRILRFSETHISIFARYKVRTVPSASPTCWGSPRSPYTPARLYSTVRSYGRKPDAARTPLYGQRGR